MMRTSYWLALRGLIGGTIVGALVTAGLMWSAGDLDRWQSRTGSIALTILLFAFAGTIGGIFMGRKSR
jgi:hypothetical protein